MLTLTLSWGEIEQVYFIRGAAGQSVPVDADPAPTALPSLSFPRLFTSILQKQRNYCPVHKYALYSFQSAALKPITAQPWEQTSRAGCRAAHSPSPLQSCWYQYPK